MHRLPLSKLLTIENAYLLPLISEIIDKVGKAKVFTKLDLQWGYNNIRIKKGHEWKAAFATKVGITHCQHVVM